MERIDSRTVKLTDQEQIVQEWHDSVQELHRLSPAQALTHIREEVRMDGPTWKVLAAPDFCEWLLDIDPEPTPNDPDTAPTPDICGATYLIKGPDPYGTECDNTDPNHYPTTQHEGPDPYGTEGRLRWSGGGTAGGDPLPYHHVAYINEGIGVSTEPILPTKRKDN